MTRARNLRREITQLYTRFGHEPFRSWQAAARLERARSSTCLILESAVRAGLLDRLDPASGGRRYRVARGFVPGLTTADRSRARLDHDHEMCLRQAQRQRRLGRPKEARRWEQLAAAIHIEARQVFAPVRPWKGARHDV